MCRRKDAEEECMSVGTRHPGVTVRDAGGLSSLLVRLLQTCGGVFIVRTGTAAWEGAVESRHDLVQNLDSSRTANEPSAPLKIGSEQGMDGVQRWEMSAQGEQKDVRWAINGFLQFRGWCLRYRWLLLLLLLSIVLMRLVWR
jgi:hypothetical protein